MIYDLYITITLLYVIHYYIIAKRKFSGKIFFFLSRGEVLCISESNFRNDITCLLHLFLGITM